MKGVSLSERKSKIILERVSLPPCAGPDTPRAKRHLLSAEGQTDKQERRRERERERG